MDMTIKTQISLCSSWSNVRTLTYKTQHASMWSILRDIQHLAQQQGQHMIQWSMVQKWTFLHFQQAHMANRQRSPDIDVNMRIKARAAGRQTGSTCWGYCATCDPKWNFRRRRDKKHTFLAMTRKRNGSRIMWREIPLWQESEFKTQRQWLRKCWTTWLQLQTWGRQLDSPKQHLNRW